jgi:hypothetical protein
MNSELNDSIFGMLKLQQTAINEIIKSINETIKSSGATTATLILIFRLLMQYDTKLAEVFAVAIDREVVKNKQHPSQLHPQYDELLSELLEIARNPTQRDEKGRPLWIRPVADGKTEE